jgi:hypothetical protein
MAFPPWHRFKTGAPKIFHGGATIKKPAGTPPVPGLIKKP